MDGPFALTYRVRFDEAGADGWLRPSGFLRFAQDIAWQHSEAEGYDRAWYEARRQLWLVRAASLRIDAPIAHGSRIEVTTEVTGWRRVLARRRTRFTTEGTTRPSAEAVTDWVLVGPTGRPVSVPAALVERFASGATFTPMRVRLPPVGGDAIRFSMEVRDAEVDPAGHMNNAAYVDLIDAAIVRLGSSSPAARLARRYRLEYLRSAAPRSELTIRAWIHGDGMACDISASGVERCRAEVSAG